MAIKLLQNCTPKRLLIRGRGGTELLLSPLERGKVVDEEELQPFDLRALELRDLVHVDDPPASDRVSTVLGAIPVTAFFYWMLGLSISDSFPQFWLVGGGLLVLGLVLALVIAWRGAGGTLRSGVQFMSLMFAAVIAIGLPAGIIYLFGGGPTLFAEDRDLLALGRAIQFLFIATAALLPGLLYYLFDRQQLDTLRERFEQQIFRFDPHVRTLADVRARYGRQLEEIYGQEQAGYRNRLSRGKRWPILVATLVMTLGWTLVLTPVHVSDAPPLMASPGDLLTLFAPQSNPVIFGFLGAYFFALQTVLHRFIRRDLKPSAYASISVRFFVAMILAWVLMELHVMDEVAGGVAFLVGIVPETGVALIQEFLRKRAGLARFLPSSYAEEHPLTQLEGIGLYDRARLEDEGVTNVQSLAHHDLIDLMIETRIPVARLVDWVDQAVLYLHLERTRKAGADGGRSSWADRFDAYGIRNATDLLRACAVDPDVPDSPPRSPFSPDPDPNVEAELQKQLLALIAVMRDDEWLENLLHWRRPQRVQDVTVVAEAAPPPETVPTEETPLPGDEPEPEPGPEPEEAAKAEGSG